MKAETGSSSKPKQKPKSKKDSKSELEDNLSARSEDYKEKPVPRTHCRDHPSFELGFYCETCEDLACEECRISGPHNNQEHWIMEVGHAYQSRLLKLGFLLSNKLAGRRQVMLDHVKQLSAARVKILQH